MPVYSKFLWMQQQEKLSASIVAVIDAVALGVIMLRYRWQLKIFKRWKSSGSNVPVSSISNIESHCRAWFNLHSRSISAMKVNVKL